MRRQLLVVSVMVSCVISSDLVGLEQPRLDYIKKEAIVRSQSMKRAYWLVRGGAVAAIAVAGAAWYLISREAGSVAPVRTNKEVSLPDAQAKQLQLSNAIAEEYLQSRKDGESLLSVIKQSLMLGVGGGIASACIHAGGEGIKSIMQQAGISEGPVDNLWRYRQLNDSLQLMIQHIEELQRAESNEQLVAFYRARLQSAHAFVVHILEQLLIDQFSEKLFYNQGSLNDITFGEYQGVLRGIDELTVSCLRVLQSEAISDELISEFRQQVSLCKEMLIYMQSETQGTGRA